MVVIIVISLEGGLGTPNRTLSKYTLVPKESLDIVKLYHFTGSVFPVIGKRSASYDPAIVEGVEEYN